jgi:hypothetical protein
MGISFFNTLFKNQPIIIIIYELYMCFELCIKRIVLYSKTSEIFLESMKPNLQ